jgi:hypothetical protein
MDRIEHPARNSDLKSLRNFDHQDLLSASAEGAHHFNFRAVKRMVAVVDLLREELVSSVGSRCATAMPVS